VGYKLLQSDKEPRCVGVKQKLNGVNLSSNPDDISFPVSDWECYYRGSASVFI